MQSISNIQIYCDTAQSTFDTTLAANHTTLATFIGDQPVPDDVAVYEPCPVTVRPVTTVAARAPKAAAKPAAKAAR